MEVPNVSTFAVSLIDDRIEGYETDLERLGCLELVMDGLPDFMEWLDELLEDYNSHAQIPEIVFDPLRKDIRTDASVRFLWDYCQGLLDDVKMNMEDAE